jgi:hypothetical protein
MKKLSQILAVMAIVLASFAGGSTAFAAATCQEGYTGPDSNNLCTSIKEYECTVNNTNTVAIVTENDQTAGSGTSVNINNTQSGSSSTGSATNSNGVTFNVTVNNGDDSKGICKVAATIPATPETPVTPKVDVVAPVKSTPAVLAATSGDATSGYLVVIATALGIGSVVSYLAAKAYRQRQS